MSNIGSENIKNEIPACSLRQFLLENLFLAKQSPLKTHLKRSKHSKNHT